MIHMHDKKKQPILEKVMKGYKTFFARNFVNYLKQTLREINLFAAVRQSPLKFSNDCLIC